LSLFAAASVGCSSSTTTGGGGSGGSEEHPEACVATVESTSHEVPECKNAFCAPAERHLVLSNADGKPGLQANCNGDYCALSFSQGDASIYLSFDPTLAQSSLSNDSVHQKFQYLWAQVDFPTAPTDHSAFEYQTDAKWGLAAAFESISFENGRIKATIHDQTTRVEQDIKSDESGCVSGDVGGECYCDYAGFTIPVVIDLDLSVGPISSD
jgi:hypothetical protein